MLHKYKVFKNGCTLAWMHSALTLFNEKLWSFTVHKRDESRDRCSHMAIGLSDQRVGVMSPFLYSLPQSQLQICLWLRRCRQVGDWRHGNRDSLEDGDESAMLAGGGPPGFVVAMRTTCCLRLSSEYSFSLPLLRPSWPMTNKIFSTHLEARRH